MKKITSFTIAVFLLFLSFANAQNDNDRNVNQIGPKTVKVDLQKYAQVYYVSDNIGIDKKGEGTKNSPFKTIIYALSQITSNSEQSPVALLVAEGAYSGNTIDMKPYVDLYGGFNSQNWERDIYNYLTTLDGLHQYRVVVAADNCNLDGVKITNGLARDYGGGILCDDTSPTISNCFITNNYVMEPVPFNYNRIHQKGNNGGGIACRYNAVPVITNNIFYENKTSIGYGAGISFYGMLRNDAAPPREIVDNFMIGAWVPVVKNNVFIHNVAGVHDVGRTRSSNGGAISCSTEARPVIENNMIICNQAKGRSDAGGIYSENFSYPVIRGNWILGNISDDDGGGIYTNHTGHALIEDNFIAGNWTLGNGVGGVRISKEGRASILNNIIVNNLTGGGVQSVDGYMILKNNVIMDNKGNSSVKYTNLYSYFQPSVIEGNIIRDNEGKIIIETAYNGQVIIKDNNLSNNEFSKDNYNKAVKLGSDKIEGKVVMTNFDPNTYQTRIETDILLDNDKTVGRVLKIGDYWGVIIKVESKILTVWGNVNWRSADEDNFTIISDYKE